MVNMISSFGNQLAQDIFEDQHKKVIRKFSPDLYEVARRKMFYLQEAESLQDLRVPPGNKLEALKGNLKGFFSIRINNQWRLVFKWKDGSPHEVAVIDYHK
jgi:toxin HigB-1